MVGIRRNGHVRIESNALNPIGDLTKQKPGSKQGLDSALIRVYVPVCACLWRYTGGCNLDSDRVLRESFFVCQGDKQMARG